MFSSYTESKATLSGEAYSNQLSLPVVEECRRSAQTRVHDPLRMVGQSLWLRCSCISAPNSQCCPGVKTPEDKQSSSTAV